MKKTIAGMSLCIVFILGLIVTSPGNVPSASAKTVPAHISARAITRAAKIKKFIRKRTAAGPGLPRGASGECEDGTVSFVRNRARACKAHGGVMLWFR